MAAAKRKSLIRKSDSSSSARAKRDQQIIHFATKFIAMAGNNAIGAKPIHDELVKIRQLLTVLVGKVDTAATRKAGR